MCDVGLVPFLVGMLCGTALVVGIVEVAHLVRVRRWKREAASGGLCPCRVCVFLRAESRMARRARGRAVVDHHVDNSTRAQGLVVRHLNCRLQYCGHDDGLCEGCAAATDDIERQLNLAEDRGVDSVVPGTVQLVDVLSVDVDTVEALKGLVRDTLEPLRENMLSIPPVAGEILDNRAGNICQVIIANFRIRLMTEDEAETDAHEMVSQ